MYRQSTDLTRLDRMPRRYESSVRAERAVENRGRLVAAAHELFMGQGWTATTMTQVAAAAGLARPTVYLHFDTKLDLLIACIDTALSDVPVRDRSDYQAIEKGRSLNERRPRDAGCAVLTSGQPRSSGSWTTPPSAPRRQPESRLEWSSADMTSSPTHVVSSWTGASHQQLSWMKSGPSARA